MHRSDILVFADSNPFLQDHISGVYLMLQHERRQAGLFLAVHNRPVDRCCSAVLRQQ